MTGDPGFGGVVARMLESRGLSVSGLSHVFGIEEGELQTVLDGADPRLELVRRLASAFGLHLEDMLVIAGIDLPDDLKFLDPRARGWLRRLVSRTIRLRPTALDELLRYVESLPRELRTEPVPHVPARHHYEPGIGGVLLHMLHNRNLDWGDAAWMLGEATDGRIYWSASTVGMVGAGRKEVTPELLVALAPVLGISPDDLSAVAGMDIPSATPAAESNAFMMADVLWEARSLTVDQVKKVYEKAESLSEG
ncbi:antitoxin component HigA of HigAB toxin-antitoxin module [Catenulispora sp. GP43]|uniref:XRE family transcriptional regulator n=1 Tax=Catenulispora sp. GP43 TaxID=3156263 RepID=UPI003515E031